MTVTLNPTPGMPDHMVAHLEHASTAVQTNLQTIAAQHAQTISALRAQLTQTMGPSTPAKLRMVRIRHIAGEHSDLFSRHTACRGGCSHCCHIGVDIPRSEAQLIAKKIGRPLAEPASPRSIEVAPSDQFVGQACTFLEAGRCSIHAHRPLMCRTLINLDSSATLCELVAGIEIPVPYANTTAYKAAFALVSQAEDFADIREWFPPV